jgi:hypothetical protein
MTDPPVLIILPQINDGVPHDYHYSKHRERLLLWLLLTLLSSGPVAPATRYSTHPDHYAQGFYTGENLQEPQAQNFYANQLWQERHTQLEDAGFVQLSRCTGQQWPEAQTRPQSNSFFGLDASFANTADSRVPAVFSGSGGGKNHLSPIFLTNAHHKRTVPLSGWGNDQSGWSIGALNPVRPQARLSSHPLIEPF